MLHDVAIIIPAYNEGEVLRSTVEELVAYIRENGFPWRIVVVDDGSQERQAEVLRDLPVVCLRHCVNAGQGAALQTGMTYALKTGADAAVHFDGDGQHSPQDIPVLLRTLEGGADLAVGSRFLRVEDTARIPQFRKWLLKVARRVDALFTGIRLTDAHNGFRALNRKALEAIELHENRMAHASEIIMQARQHSLVIQEVPVTIRYTEYSRQKGQHWTGALDITIDLLFNKLFRG